jgi:hypothetical protein
MTEQHRRPLRLRRLEWIATDHCRATFEAEGDDSLETEFTVDRRDGVVTGVLTTADGGDLFRRLDGTAAQRRGMVRAIAAFCDAAQDPGSGVI